MPASRIMIAGGAGFIGSALTRQLIAGSDAHLLVYDALTYAAAPAALDAVRSSQRLRIEQGDIAEATVVRRVLAAFRPDVVINLAAETHVDRSIDGPGPFLRSNVIGVFTLLEAVLDHWRGLKPEAQARFRFHQVSTDEVFGALGAQGRFDEASRYDPRSPYSATKAAADHLVRAWGHTFGLPTLVTNCSNNYGPFQFPEKLIPLIVARALRGESLPIYGDGLQVRDWLHVEDHARGLRLAFERGRPGSTYLFGGDGERTNLDLVRSICVALDQHAPRADGSPHEVAIAFVADRPGHDRRYAVDASLARTELGWTPEIDLDAGLRDTVAWYVQNRGWLDAQARAGATARRGQARG